MHKTFLVLNSSLFRHFEILAIKGKQVEGCLCDKKFLINPSQTSFHIFNCSSCIP